MATFFGGAELAQVIRVTGSVTDLDAGEYPVIYTIPNGYYAELKFAFIGQSTNFPNNYFAGWNGGAIFVVPPEVTIANTSNFLNSRMPLPNGTYAVVREEYGVNSTSPGTSSSNPTSYYSMHLREGTKFIPIVSIGGNANLSYEIEVFLYKKP